MNVNKNEIYTLEEAQAILKVSRSTILRLIKKGLIKTAKVGRQYRILGQEILHLVSPELEKKVGDIYRKSREWVYDGIEKPK
ncbi:MAG: helix-turn-helix domain-containing protein [Candidatus Omnitrophica bacterium]|nr:helix-turn-helix domain-containing protein [Candidatus Omnitrophota bacterium]